ncbi:MAG: hypothetical protein RLZZ436_751, partial [Planctomycetota bacterium]
MTGETRLQGFQGFAPGDGAKRCQRWPWRLLVAAALLLCTGGPLCAGENVASVMRPNVVLIVADDMGWGDLGVQG